MPTNSQLYKSDDWHSQRALGIGGSEAAAALGMSPWKTPLQLYLEKTGDVPAPSLTGDNIIFGQLLEPVIRNEFARRTGLCVEIMQAPAVSVQYPWMRANLDGWIPDGPRVFEAKTARTDTDFGEPGSDNIPVAYLLQCQHMMIVTNAMRCEVAVLIGGSDFRTYTINYNTDLADLIIEGERQFWDAVQRREPPAPTSLAEINARWRKSRPVGVELSPAAAAACERLREIKEAEKTAQKEADACEFLVKEEMGEADTATVNGQLVVTWKTAKSARRFDTESFKLAHPEIAARFTKEIPGSRKIPVEGGAMIWQGQAHRGVAGLGRVGLGKAWRGLVWQGGAGLGMGCVMQPIGD